MVADFFAVDAPLPERSDGVKLGESTLNRFLLLFGSLSRLPLTTQG